MFVFGDISLQVLDEHTSGGHSCFGHSRSLLDSSATVQQRAKYRMRQFINIVEKSANLLNTETPAFKNWFRNSRVVDANGKPLRVFHGGSSAITAFDKSKIGQNFGVDKEGFFFTTNTYYQTAWYGGDKREIYHDMYSAGAYAKNVDGAIYPCYLRMENPLYIQDWVVAYGIDLDHEVADYGHVQATLDNHKKDIMRDALADGHDGVIASHGDDHVFVVFEPNQIKSVFNQTFNPDSDHISEDQFPK